MNDALFDETDCEHIRLLGIALVRGRSSGKKIIGDMLSLIKDRSSGDPLRGMLNGLAVMLEGGVPYFLIVSLWYSDSVPRIRQAGRILRDIGFRP